MNATIVQRAKRRFIYGTRVLRTRLPRERLVLVLLLLAACGVGLAAHREIAPGASKTKLKGKVKNGNLILTATVKPSSATGNVAFLGEYPGQTTFGRLGDGEVPLTAGVAQFTISPPCDGCSWDIIQNQPSVTGRIPSSANTATIYFEAIYTGSSTLMLSTSNVLKVTCKEDASTSIAVSPKKKPPC
jgi:hypothetical protein